MSELGAIFYRGPSLLTGDPIVGILTGLEAGQSIVASATFLVASESRLRAALDQW